MPDAPTVPPFGYKFVTGQSQKGDGIWNGAEFVKVRKCYPSTEPGIIIRRCDTEQPPLLSEVDLTGVETMEFSE